MGVALLNYKVDGRIKSSEQITVSSGDSISATYTGATFRSWTISAGSGWRYTTSGNKITFTAVSSSTSFVANANFDSIQLTVSYEANGGSVSPTSETVAYGSSVTLPTPTRTHYFCLGWYDARQGGSKVGDAGGSLRITASRTLYAHWQSSERVVIFHPNGGSVSPYFARVYQGEAFGTLPTPTYAGRSFVGWYTSIDGGTLVTSATLVTQSDDFTLYAHWTAATASHLLTFDAAGGSVSPSSRTVVEGAAYGQLPTPTRTGYTFVGWFASTVGSQVVTAQTTMGSRDVRIYAHWTGNPLTVSLDANGGSVSPSSIAVAFGNQVGTLPTPTYAGRSFVGWFYGAERVDATFVPTSSVTLVAHWSSSATVANWTIVKYPIAFELNGGTLAAGYERKYTMGQSRTLPTSQQVTKSGASFGGWFAAADFSGQPVTTISSSEKGKRKFYAKWI